MLRSFDILMIVALIAGAAWTFKIKSDSEAALQRAAVLERQIELEREAIDLLRADWSLLTSPDRLQKLVDRYKAELDLEPVAATHIGKASEIPLREQLNAVGDEKLRRAAEAPAAARIETGSVEDEGDQ
jgi:hypothetical protein